MNFKSFFSRGLLAALSVLPLASALAQTFPGKPVRIIVPQTPGGASDALARIVGQKLSEKWGQPVVIENRAGAGGNIGMDAMAKSPALIREINADIKKVLEDKETMDKFATLGAEPFDSTPQEFAAMLSADIAKWAAVVKSSGATAD